MVSNQDYMGFSGSKKVTMKYFQEKMCTMKYLFHADYQCLRTQNLIVQ